MTFITLHEERNGNTVHIRADAILSILPRDYWLDGKEHIGSSVLLPSECCHEVRESPDEVLRMIREATKPPVYRLEGSPSDQVRRLCQQAQEGRFGVPVRAA